MAEQTLKNTQTTKRPEPIPRDKPKTEKPAAPKPQKTPAAPAN